MDKLIYIALGGALGAVSRYLLGAWIQRPQASHFPWHTLTVNVVGCLLIGAFWGFVEARQATPEYWRPLLVTGLLGGFTTYSTFGYESFALLRDGHWPTALLYIGVTTIAGLAAVAGGYLILRQLMPV